MNNEHELPDFDYQPPEQGFEYIANLVNQQLDGIRTMLIALSIDPSNKNNTKLNDILTLHFASIYRAFNARMRECTDTTEGLTAVATYIEGIERRRVEILSGLTGDDAATYSPLEITIENDDDKKEVDTMHAAYMESVRDDLEKFEGVMVQRYYEKPSTIRRENRKIQMKNVGSHALDIAKVGVGVVGGIIVAKKAKLLE